MEILNSYINSYMDTLEKVELTSLVRHIARLLKSGIPIYNSEVQAGRKTRRRRTGAIANRFAFYANAIKNSSVFHVASYIGTFCMQSSS